MLLHAKVTAIELGEQYGDEKPRVLLTVKDAECMYRNLKIVDSEHSFALGDRLVIRVEKE